MRRAVLASLAVLLALSTAGGQAAAPPELPPIEPAPVGEAPVPAGEAPVPPTAPAAPTVPPAGPGLAGLEAELAAEAAELQSYSVELDEKTGVVRVTLQLDGAKPVTGQGFVTQGSYALVLPNTRLAGDLPRSITVARGTLAELLLRPLPDSDDLRVVARLNAPAPCRAWAVPSEKQVLIECAPAEKRGPDPDVDADPLVTAEFVDTDIRLIVEALMAQAGANVVMQPGLSGDYSVSLHDVTLAQALDAIAEAWDLAWYRMPGDIYVVGRMDTLRDRLVDEVLIAPVGWSAAEVWALLAREYPELRLGLDPEQLLAAVTLPVRGPVSTVVRARRRVRDLPPRGLDQPVVGPLFPAEETLLLHPRYLDLETAAQLAREAGPAVTVTVDAAAGRLRLEGPSNEVLRVRRVVEERDVPAAEESEAFIVLPAVAPERLDALADEIGLDLKLVDVFDDEMMVWVRGSRERVEQLQDAARELRDLRRVEERDDTRPSAPAGGPRRGGS